MRKLAVTICVVVLIFFSTNIIAQGNIDTATAIQNWDKYISPGEHHAMLAKANGTWDCKVDMWMTAEAAPQKAILTVTNKMILGGRYQVSTYEGKMMDMSFEGMATTGYDNLKKIFISTWVDNMGTGVVVLQGTWDNATKSINLKGTTVDAMTNKETVIREVITMIDDNTQKLEMYGPDPVTGKEFKTMEIKMTRKK